MVPDVVKAGEALVFTVKLDRGPNFEGGVVQFRLEGPDTNISTSTGAVAAGQVECPASIGIPASATGGQWRIHVTGFFTGTKVVPLSSTDATFQVIGRGELVYPSSAEVRIKPSQAQLLRKAAIQVQLQVQELKASLAPYEKGAEAAPSQIILRNIRAAVESLDATQSAFRGLSGAASSTEEQVFFDDLRAGYKAAQTEFSRYLTSPASEEVLESVALKHGQARPPKFKAVVAQALRPFEQNELAYRIVADTQSLTFDLAVNSNPAGAILCYHRRGDPCRPTADNTNTVIKSLPYAIWLVQFKKAGYQPEEREHDPFREPNHILSVELRP